MTSAKDIHFTIIEYGSAAYEASWALREEILRIPLGLAFTAEDVELEKGQIHVAGFCGEELCAACVLVPEDGRRMKMQRVAVKEGFRGRGIGSGLADYCEAYALKTGYGELYCHARETAVPFYLKQHYLPDGAAFIEQTIPHQTMRKSLRPS